MAKKLKVGVVGCGNISATYFKYAPMFKTIEIAACADLDPRVAEARGREHKIAAMTPEALISAQGIDIVLNLTVPAAHFAVSLAAVKAGKHVYSEKPLTLSLKDGLALKAATERNGVKLACAPDTILGGAHQLARKAVDDGVIGKVTAGTAVIMGHGMEHWHPNPDFFFKPGGGPVLDMGPYYIGSLINLIGPVTRVAALTSSASRHRTITSRAARGAEDQGRDPHKHPRSAGIRQRRHRHPACQLGRVGASPPFDGTLWHGRLALCAGSQFLRRQRAGDEAQRHSRASAGLGSPAWH